MSLKVINEALGDINNLRYCKKFAKVASETIDNLRGYERQGEYNEVIEIYDLKVDNLFIKLTLRTDSYGEDEKIYSVQIVAPVVKTVTDYEPIKK